MIKYKNYIPFVLLALLVVLSIFVLKPFLLAIFMGILLAYIFYPLYKFGQKKSKNSTVSALLVCLLIVVIIVVPGIFLVKNLVQESYSLYLLGKQKMATGLFEDCQNSFCQVIENIGQDPQMNYRIQEILKGATNWVIKKGSDFLVSIPQIFLNLFVIFFTMFYFLKDGESFVRKLSYFLRLGEDKYHLVVGRLREIVRGVVYGYIVIALIQGAFGALGFFLFGVQSPLFWGTVMAFLALIPFLGTGFVWVPASLIVFLDGMFQDSNWLMFKGAALFIYCLIFVASLDNILKPKLMGDRAKVHPVVILLGIFGGIFVFGPLGVIVGPLILSLTLVFIDVYLVKKGKEKDKESKE